MQHGSTQVRRLSENFFSVPKRIVTKQTVYVRVTTHKHQYVEVGRDEKKKFCPILRVRDPLLMTETSIFFMVEACGADS